MLQNVGEQGAGDAGGPRELRVQGSGFWDWGLGFRVQGSGFSV